MNQPGSLLAGRYRLAARLATGGMGEVWAATDEMLDRQVAAKLVKPEYAGDAVFRQRLHAEAKSAASVRNPHVVEVYDVGEDIAADGQPVSFVIMQLVHGQSVSAALANGPFTAAETANLLTQVADALATAHSCGVVHRDIKPANLIRNDSGHITVLDFGIARAADSAALTKTGTMLGTACYLSPEQVDGEPATTASDVYSVGVVAYQCLAGRPPFDAGSDVATALAHRDQSPPELPVGVPGGLADIVMQCLSKPPSDRPTASQVAGLATTWSREQQPSGTTAVLPVVPAVSEDATTELTAVTVPADRPDAATTWLEWRRLGVVAAAAVVLIAVLAIAGAVNDHSGNGAASAASGRSPGAHVAPAANQTTHSVVVNSGQYVGEPYATAAHQLQQLGLQPQMNGTGSPSDLVTAIRPVGRVSRDSVVTLTVLGSIGGPKPHGPAGPPGHAKPKPPHGHGPKPIPPGHDKHGNNNGQGGGGEG